MPAMLVTTVHPDLISLVTLVIIIDKTSRIYTSIHIPVGMNIHKRYTDNDLGPAHDRTIITNCILTGVTLLFHAMWI